MELKITSSKYTVSSCNYLQNNELILDLEREMNELIKNKLKQTNNKMLTEEQSVDVLQQLFIVKNQVYKPLLEKFGVVQVGYSMFHAFKKTTATDQLKILEQRLKNLNIERTGYFEKDVFSLRAQNIKDSFKNGSLIVRAVCLEEIINRIFKKESSSGKYVSTSLLPAKDCGFGMKLFGSDNFVLMIDPTNVPVDTKSGKQAKFHIAACYVENKGTYYLTGRFQKQEQSDAGSIDELSKEIEKKYRNTKYAVTNSEVLWVGLDPKVIQSISLRLLNNKIPKEGVIEKFLHVMHEKDLESGKLFCELYPCFIYEEKTPHALHQIEINKLSTTKSVYKQIESIINSNLKESFKKPLSRGEYLIESSSKYNVGDGKIINTLCEITEKLQYMPLVALIDKICHPQAGWIRLGQYHNAIERVIESYFKGLDITKEILAINAGIDVDSINYNLAKNGDKQLSAKACYSLENGSAASYIIRRQIIALTNREITKICLTALEIEELVDFCEEENNIKTPSCVNRFSGKERWEDGYDPIALEFICKIGNINLFKGDNPPPAPLELKKVLTGAYKLISSNFP
jgi:hypothetical protein